MAKKLYKSTTNAIIGGVCGGIAECYDLDPTIVRVVFGIVAVLWGLGLLVYLIMFFSMPRGASKI
jgi:phage shock protein PspC (stress-responsive transcriptional regulator)